MGIVNVTPDSFSDGGAFFEPARAVDHALRLLDDGADVLDVGGESTRPGATPVDVDVERRRVLPVIEALAARGVRNVSIDTRRAAVAKDALAAGAAWINDVSALEDDDMAAVAARAQALLLMHWRRAARFDARGDDVRYADVVAEVGEFLRARRDRAVGAGVAPDMIVVDAGLGFGKSVDDNLRLLAASDALRVRTGAAAVLVGPSRKRFLGAVCGRDVPADRDAATVGAACAAARRGADIVRVHDVRACVDALRVTAAVRA
ncbi:MAG: dihydropteroate synthase [Deltaproteobacteria bacterium]|nr:dihydropteroate synthase [Deltaproteobacteria bacterium]